MYIKRLCIRCFKTTKSFALNSKKIFQKFVKKINKIISKHKLRLFSACFAPKQKMKITRIIEHN